MPSFNLLSKPITIPADLLSTFQTLLPKFNSEPTLQHYWLLGQLIQKLESTQQRVLDDIELMESLSTTLQDALSTTLPASILLSVRHFYLAFDDWSTISTELLWEHYQYLSTLTPAARGWYLREAIIQHWSAKALAHLINVMYYERWLVSSNRETLEQEAQTIARCNAE